MNATIFLQSNKGWQLHEIENVYNGAELAQRNIKIGNYAKIGNRAEIGDGAKIGVGAKIGDYAEIGDGAKIGDYAKIGNRAEIGDGADLLHCAYIQGSRHVVNYWGHGKLAIGCKVRTFSEWMTEIDEVGELANEEEYSKSEVAEYRSYVVLLQKLVADNPQWEVNAPSTTPAA